MKRINGFDCDGVITVGIRPAKDDVIITGRSFEEYRETMNLLTIYSVLNDVHFNMLSFKQKTRKSSGHHKANIIQKLHKRGIQVVNFFEDDEIQKEVIESRCPDVNVIHVVHDLTEKENVRHDDPCEDLL